MDTNDVALPENLPLHKTTPPVVLPPDVQSAGVALGQDAQEKKLSQAVSDAGVSLAKAEIPVEVSDQSWLPLSYLETERIKKQSRITDARRWFAELISYLWHQKNPEIDKEQKG